VTGDGGATWLELPPGDSDWDRYVALCPDQLAAVAGLVAAAWSSTDPVLLELSRIRMATALGFTSEMQRRTERAQAAGLTEEKVAELAAWPTSPRFDARERACLAFAEQFVIDANGVTDAQVGDLTAQLGAEGTYTFVQAVSVLETFLRACLTLGIDPVPDADRMVAAGSAPTAVPSTQEVAR
jgi:alkylhydroperoxidase family enzyme